MSFNRNFIVIMTLVVAMGIIISGFVSEVIYPFLSLPWAVCILSFYLIIVGVYTLIRPKRVRELINHCSDSGIQGIGILIIVWATMFLMLLYIRWLGIQILRMMYGS